MQEGAESTAMPSKQGDATGGSFFRHRRLLSIQYLISLVHVQKKVTRAL